MNTARPTHALVLPGRLTIILLIALAVGLLALRVAGVDGNHLTMIAAGLASMLLLAALWDALASGRAWRECGVTCERNLPSALALNVPRVVQVNLKNPGAHAWHLLFFDQTDATLAFTALPLEVDLPAGASALASYSITPTQRGEVTFDVPVVRVRSRWRLIELQRTLGAAQSLRVFPNFAQVARYAWLAGNRRLTEIGIKAFQMRGEGTDFKELTEYRVGDPIRHIDWKATLKHNKPIVREFQDERDQCVLFLLDCGRRMRAQEDGAGAEPSHFDQALNALMLLSYVALKQGDAVGAMTFGTGEEQQQLFAPRKGIASFNALMGALYAVQPQPVYSDYMVAARDLMRRHTKRSLIVILTNFRDEDATELAPAMALLRTRHLVMLASLREQVVRHLQEQPLKDGQAARQVASAHLYAQSREDAFRKMAARDTLLMDVEPAQLAVQLVNRYHAVKRAGLL